MSFLSENDLFRQRYNSRTRNPNSSTIQLDNTMTRPTIPSREEVKMLCYQKGPFSKGFAYDDKIWIKYGYGVTLAEAAIQQYVHEKADHRIVYTPEVYDTFTATNPSWRRISIIIMEKVEGENYLDYTKQHPEETEKVLQAIADVVRHIWSLPLPPNKPPGSFGPELAVNRFFSDVGADRAFKDIGDLEDWVNQQLIEANKPDRANFRSHELCLCHLDLTEFHVLIGKPIILLDWSFSGIYPIVFEEHALINQFNLQGRKFAKGLFKQLFDDKPSKNMRSLTLAARINFVGW